jgi:hypothetical protein
MSSRALQPPGLSEQLLEPSGIARQPAFVDFGRAYYLENVTKMIETLIDFCGRGVVVYRRRSISTIRSSAERSGPRCAATTRARRTARRSSA